MEFYHYIPPVILLVVSGLSIFHKPFRIAGGIIFTTQFLNLLILWAFPSQTSTETLGNMPAVLAMSVLTVYLFIIAFRKYGETHLLKFACICAVYATLHLMCIVTFRGQGFAFFYWFYRDLNFWLNIYMILQFLKSGILGLHYVFERMGNGRFSNLEFDSGVHLARREHLANKKTQ